MRAFLATTLAAACACTAALVPRPALPALQPLTVTVPAATVPAVTVRASPAPATAARHAASDRAGGAFGADRFLALTPLPDRGGSRAANTGPQGVTSRAVKPFSLLGVTWNDGGAPLGGAVRVRTRSAATGAWSGWRDLEDGDDLPDLGSPERARGTVRGGTAPLWVGAADGVQVRVTPLAAARAAGPPTALPHGLRVDLVAPGAPAPRSRVLDDDWDGGDGYRTAARPGIVSRAGWGADESLRETAFSYTGTVRAVFVHHTASGNDYACADAPSIVRAVYRYHVLAEGWRDIGYNFLIDKCGTIYEGRAGGVARAVQGAHTLGFNSDTSGIALIGDFSRARPSAPAVRSLERLAAWKLGLSGTNAAGHTTLTSHGSNKYAYGTHVRFNTIAGHRDGYTTECPGDALYAELPAIRQAAATLQGR